MVWRKAISGGPRRKVKPGKHPPDNTFQEPDKQGDARLCAWNPEVCFRFVAASMTTSGPLTLEKETRTSSIFPDRQDLWALVLLACGVALMFWKVLFASQMLFYRDILNQSYPTAQLIHEICRKGFLPCWNPYLNFGQPILENPNSLFFYPTTLLIILLPVAIAYSLHFILHFVLAALGTYCLARRSRQSHLAAFFAASFFVLSGPVLSLGSFYNEVACAAWIPWALVLTDYAVVAGSIRPWLLLTLIFLLQFLAGEPFTLLATFGLCLAYALYRGGFFRRPLAQPTRRIVAGFVLSGCLMVALGAVQLFPALVLLRDSLRGALGFPFTQMTYWSLHPLSLVEVIVPEFFGPKFTAPSLWTPLLNFSNRPYFPSLFLGFVPVFFAFIGCTLARDRRRKFVSGAALVLLLLAFGRFTPLYQLMVWLAPVLRLVRFPIKLLIPVILLVALLAGWGIDVMREPNMLSPTRAKKAIGTLILLAVGLSVMWVVCWLVPELIGAPARWILFHTAKVVQGPSSAAIASKALRDASGFSLSMLRWQLPGLAGFALGATLWMRGLSCGERWARKALPVALFIGVGQLILVNYSVNPTVPRDFYTYHPPVLDRFEASRMPYRYADVFGSSALASVSAEALEGPLDFASVPAARGLSQPAQSEFQERLLLEHGGMLEKAEGISNVDPDWSFPVSLYQFWVFALHKVPDPAYTSCLFGRSDVRYQILGARRHFNTLREITPVFDGTLHPSYLYENRCYTPRAYVAGTAIYSPGADETLARLSSPGFDATQEVLLASRAGVDPLPSVPGPAGQVESFHRQPNSVTLRVNLSRPGYVVLLDRFDPNWHATLDGREVRILRADHLFRAVQSGTGQHEVRFYYRQQGLVPGLVVSIAALVLSAILFLLNLRIPILAPESRG